MTSLGQLLFLKYKKLQKHQFLKESMLGLEEPVKSGLESILIKLGQFQGAFNKLVQLKNAS